MSADSTGNRWWEQFAKHKRGKPAAKKNADKGDRARRPVEQKQPADAEASLTGSQEAADSAPQVLPASVRRCPRPALVVQGRKSPQGLQIPVWIYDTAILGTSGNCADGETVAVFSKSGKFLGSAIFNSASKIRARLFSYDMTSFDDDYVEHAIIRAWNRRRTHYDVNDSCRVVFSESDGLPGLIVDKLGDVLVIQSLTLAIERRLEVIIRTLRALFAPKATVTRRDSPYRVREGLEVADPEVVGELKQPLAVELDGVTYFCDPLHGQKTGMYLDQRLNRRLLKPYAAGKRVLDLFCHVGGWALAAAKAGATRVLGVDSASPALELARRAASVAEWSHVEFVESDVFDFLEEKRNELAGSFDVVVCDPPAFAKSQKHLAEAERAYLSLNYRAMKILPVGGLLVTCSCSQHLSEEHFQLILETAARNARMRFQIVALGGQPPDHPVLLGFPESRYLKCVFLQRIE